MHRRSSSFLAQTGQFFQLFIVVVESFSKVGWLLISQCWRVFCARLEIGFKKTASTDGVTHTGIANETYSFDAAGNRTGGGYTTGTTDRMSSDGTFNYVYDNEGTMTTRTRICTASAPDKTVTYTWDHRNRLTKIVNKNNAGAITKQADYSYDVFNRRASKLLDADGAGAGVAVRTWYVYQGEDVIANSALVAFGLWCWAVPVR